MDDLEQKEKHIAELLLQLEEQVRQKVTVERELARLKAVIQSLDLLISFIRDRDAQP